MLDFIGLKLGDKMDRCLVLILSQVPINTVVACIDQPAFEKIVAGGITSI